MACIDWRESPLTGCMDNAIDGINVTLFDTLGVYGASWFSSMTGFDGKRKVLSLGLP